MRPEALKSRAAVARLPSLLKQISRKTKYQKPLPIFYAKGVVLLQKATIDRV